MTQNEFLHQVVRAARLNSFEGSLFEGLRAPSVDARLQFSFVDLFAGIGGFRLGLSAVGGRCVFTSEWDRFAVRTYKAWYGDGHVYDGDIRDEKSIDIRKDIPDHDVLCAGFPCQPFSIAGVSKKLSLGRKHGFEDAKQGNLFFRICDIVDAKRPPILFLENVKNLRSHDRGNTWRVIEDELRKRKYAVFASVVDAAAWVPQHRERIFIVCFDERRFGPARDIPFAFPSTDGLPFPRLESILEPDPDPKYMLSDSLWGYLQRYAEKHRAKGNGFGFGLVGGSDIARTISARYYKDGSEILIRQRGWRNPRRLTPREAMRLMGYSDELAKMFGHEAGFPQVVSDAQSYKQFGNSVVPPVVKAISERIVSVIGWHLNKGRPGCLVA